MNGLGTADVQVAVGIEAEAGMDLADLALGQISVDDVGQKVFYLPCVFPLSKAQSAYIFHNTI